jgi:hypothetical protein
VDDLMPAIGDIISKAIDALDDPVAQPQLEKCVPTLLATLDNWNGPQLQERDSNLLAVACVDACRIFSVSTWPVPDGETERKLAALETINRLRSPPSDDSNTAIVRGVAALLDPAAIELQLRDAARIRAEGELPLIVALLALAETKLYGLITTIRLPRVVRTLH